MSRPVRSLKAQLGAQTRHHPEQDHSDLKRDLRAEVLAEHVARVVAEAPPLTDAQAQRIVGLLLTGGPGHA
jgi:hypothetical protein